jgi:asparagine synthase (glutamine-hydrolysing)
MKGFHLTIDLEGGLVGASEPGGSGVLLLVDARLDNRRELTEALAGRLRGVNRTPEDAELILAAYLEWGEDCPRHLVGDFAFSLWNPRSRRLFCACDPLGVRPLYYGQAGSRFGVASNVGALLGNPVPSRDVDLVAIGDYLLGMTSEPDRTFFTGVHRLPAGHTLTAAPGGPQIRRYWDVAEIEPLDLSEEDAASRFFELLSQAVRDRLDVPGGSVAVAMSGGLDSTSVAAIAARELARRGNQPLVACSFVFDKLTACDERSHIARLSETLGIQTAFIDAERFWFLGDEEVYSPSLETPLMSWESGFRQMLGALQERGARILLTGHGADDLLLGSKRVYVDRLRGGDLRVVNEIWKYSRSRQYGWRPFYRLLVEPTLGSGATLALRRLFRRTGRGSVPSWIAPDFARRTGLKDRLAEVLRIPAQGRARDELYRNLIARPSYQSSVDWYDRNARPLGIEVRHPFLDRRLFELIFALPPAHLVRLGERKPLLRRALAGVLPDFIRLRRDKTSLGSFVDFSLRKEADRVRSLLAAPLSAELGIVDGEAVRHAFESYCRGERIAEQRSLWSVISLELWLRRYAGRFNNLGETVGFSRKAA